MAALPFRLHHAFGLMGYSISPGGARVLLDTCLPLTDGDIELDDRGIKIHNGALDCVANAAYRVMKAYVCIPPLVVSENRRGT
jgi:hypothetical protein